jgi:hypothetical protein
VRQRSRLSASVAVVSTGAEVEVDPAALPFHLVDLTLAVVLAAGLEGKQFCVPGKALKRLQ